MKIIKQLSDDEFVIKLEEQDKHHYAPESIRVAHDYVEFNFRQYLSGSDTFHGPYTGNSNTVGHITRLTIPIRTFVEQILPVLKDHEYCQPEHLLQRDGTPNYTWGMEVVSTPNGEETIYHVRRDGEADWTDFDEKTFNTFIRPQIDFDVANEEKKDTYLKQFYHYK